MPGLVAVVGATGTGKSDLSLALAQRGAQRGVHWEVVNADAMQLYRGMNIGTAKLPIAERRGIAHHLLDVLDVTEEAAVARYQRAARAAIAEIHARGNSALLVGGSGLYVSSVLFDFAFPPRDEALRASLEAELVELGVGALFARLRELDPVTAERIDSKNARRVVRALEVHALGSRGHGAALPAKPVPWHPASVLALGMPRERLVPRLDARVERMWSDGLLDEVKGLIPLGIEHGVTAQRAIGYAQALAQLAGTISRDEAIADTQRLTRRYARRQVSWFRRYAGAVWLDAEAPDLIDDAVAAISAT